MNAVIDGERAGIQQGRPSDDTRGQYGPRVLEIDTIPGFVRKILPNREAIIERGLLYPKSRMGITGPGKKGKSMFTQNLVLDLAAGTPFLGEFPIPKLRRVLYIQWEVSPQAMQERLRNMLAARPGTDFSAASLVNAPFLKIDQKQGFDQLCEVIQRSQCEVCVFDPFYRAHSANEDKAHEMRDVVDQFERLISRFGISVVIVHHHAKSAEGKEDGQLARGSTVFGDWVDTQLVLRGAGETAEKKALKRLSFVLRNDVEPEPMNLVLDADSLWLRRAVDEASVRQSSEAQRALEAAQAIFNRGQQVDAAAMEQELTVSRNTAKRFLALLERFGWRRSDGKRGAMIYTPADMSNQESLTGLTGDRL